MSVVKHKSSSHLLELAEHAYMLGNYEVAEKHCLELGDVGESYLLLASIYFQLKKFQQSEDILRQVTEDVSQQEMAFIALGKIYKARQENRKAVRYFTKALKINPELDDVYIEMAEIFVNINDTNIAIRLYKRVLQFQPQNVKILCSLGAIYLRLQQYKEAEICFSNSIDIKKTYAAWNYLDSSLNDKSTALDLVEHSLSIDPSSSESYINLGNFATQLKLMNVANLAFGKASNMMPHNALELENQANIYYLQGLQDKAIHFYKLSLRCDPNSTSCHYNLANVYKELGYPTDAENHYKMALAISPYHIDSMNNLANIYRDNGKLNDALKLYLQALELNFEYATGHNNIGCVYKLQGHLQEALAHFNEAIRIQPNFSEAICNKGNVLKELLDMNGAYCCFEIAIRLNPHYPEAYCSMANLYKDNGYYVDAITWYKYALQIKNDYHEAYCNMIHSLLMICDWTDYESYITKIVALMNYQMSMNLFPSVQPHHAMLYPLSADMYRYLAAKHAELNKNNVTDISKASYDYSRKPDTKLKIGYVSSDFGNHPSSHLMQSIPGFHDKLRYEVYCYSLSPDDGTMFRSKIAKECDRFVDLSNVSSIVAAANIIHADGIHILVNMNGYTKGARNEIFALKPAPIQVMWLGYPGTSGADFMDYIITDRVTSPLDYANLYSEKFAYMPDSFFIGDHHQMFPHLRNKLMVTDNFVTGEYESECNIVLNTTDIVNLIDKDMIRETGEIVTWDRQEITKLVVELPLNDVKSMIDANVTHIFVNEIKIQNGLLLSYEDQNVAFGEKPPNSIIVTTRQQYAILENAIVYCNFNQLYKIDPDILKTWFMILKQVPNSVLWLLKFPSPGEINILNAAINFGLPADRIIFSNVAAKEEHVRRAQLADVCLDTCLCNGHTTTMDVLWAGTPVVTMPLQLAAARIAASQLCALRCPELVASSIEHYQKIAVRLGVDREYLRAIRSKVWEARRKSTLFDCKMYAKDLENLYSKMWTRFERELKPAHIVPQD